MSVASDIEIAGRRVPRIGFGGKQLAGPAGWGPPADRAAARALLRTAVELGIRYIDTADVLGPGVSEEIIAETLHPYAGDLVIATKSGMTRTAADPSGWGVLGHPRYLVQQAYTSAFRLRLDHIPLYYLHRVDPQVPLEDQIGALVTLRDAGLIGAIGLSEVTVEQLDVASRMTAVGAVQNNLSYFDRRNEPVLTAAQRMGIPFVPFFPLGRGAQLDGSEALAAVAARHAVSPAVVALAWLLHASDRMLPIPGTARPSRLTENLGALNLALDDDDVALLEASPAAPTH